MGSNHLWSRYLFLRLSIFIILVLIGSNTLAGDIEITRRGAEISDGPVDLCDTESSYWTELGGLVVDPAILSNDTEVTYTFLVPDPGLYNGMMNLKVSIYGRGKSWSYEPKLYAGIGVNRVVLNNDNRLPEAEAITIDQVPLSCLRNPSGNDPGYWLDISLDFRAIDWYDIKYIKVEYSFTSIDQNDLEIYQVILNASQALINFYDTTLPSAWPFALQGTENAEKAIRSILPGVTTLFNPLVAASVQAAKLVDLYQGLKGTFQDLFNFMEFSTLTGNLILSNDASSAYSDMIYLAGRYFVDMDDNGQIDGSMDFSDVLDSLSDLEAKLREAGRRYKDELSNGNTGIVNCAKNALMLISPMLRFDPNTGNELSESYIVALQMYFNPSIYSLQKATNPRPSDGLTEQSVNTNIIWSNGGGATSYDVYFGTNSSPDNGDFKGNQPSLTYDPPGALAPNTTYYWRIDPRNAANKTTGDVWQFTTGSTSALQYLNLLDYNTDDEFHSSRDFPQSKTLFMNGERVYANISIENNNAENVGYRMRARWYEPDGSLDSTYETEWVYLDSGYWAWRYFDYIRDNQPPGTYRVVISVNEWPPDGLTTGYKNIVEMPFTVRDQIPYVEYIPGLPAPNTSAFPGDIITLGNVVSQAASYSGQWDDGNAGGVFAPPSVSVNNYSYTLSSHTTEYTVPDLQGESARLTFTAENSEGSDSSYVDINILPFVGKVATPIFSPNGGDFTGHALISLSCSTPSATIRYTMDGTTPTASSTEFIVGMIIGAYPTKTFTVKARAFKDGYNDSDDASATFTILAPYLSVTPTNQTVNSNSGLTLFTIENTGDGTMPWTASVISGDDWLSITSSTSGINNGTITAAYQASTLGSPRTGTIRVFGSFDFMGGTLTDVTVIQSGIPVTFPDFNLETIVREAIGKPNGDIYENDLEELTSLSADELNINNLSGVEYCSNLTSLSLRFNQISDISTLSGLVNLTSLDLYGNQISDISALSGLTDLTSLDLRENQISDITALSGIVNLNLLYIDNNQISDISALSGLTNLISLGLSENQISDISALSGLVNLNSLSLDRNQIRNISALSGLSNLENLFLFSNQISDISALSGLVNLTYLGLYNNQISDISALSGLTNLTSISLFGNQISDISALSGLVNLTYLGLHNNQISDISALSGLTNLTSLTLGGNQISDVNALTGLIKLNTLYIDNNQINDISALSGLVNLTLLFLNNNQISDISALSGLTNLDWLNSRSNHINNISALSGLMNLEYLYLDYNPLENEAIINYIPLIINNNPDIYLTYGPIYSLSISCGDGGLIIIPGEGSYQYGMGYSVLITTTPDSGYTVDSWAGTDNDSSTSTTNTVMMYSDRNVAVTFEIDISSTDTDNDGLPDEFEIQIIDADPNDEINFFEDVDPRDDFDEDGYSNLRELLSQTDPTYEGDIPPCFPDSDEDYDFDGLDLFFFSEAFGSEDCFIESSGCVADLDNDGDVDEIDLFLLSEDFGRICSSYTQ